ncbi:hypothetical protein [Crocosphaera sp.]|nr:hypothetical protein [Crocosphaera sp.]MDJ0579286.1 hypothetical protein [Crocosphaera sp.]
MTLEVDGGKDTLPSELTIIDILRVIKNISPEEQTTLAQEF